MRQCSRASLTAAACGRMLRSTSDCMSISRCQKSRTRGERCRVISGAFALAQRDDIRWLARNDASDVCAPAPHGLGALFEHFVALINTANTCEAAAAVVQTLFDDLDAHAELLQAAGKCSSRVVQNPWFDHHVFAALLAGGVEHQCIEALLVLAEATDRSMAGRKDEPGFVFDVRRGTNDL